MSIITDELRIQRFPCPFCGKVISSEEDTCPYCNTAINDANRYAAIREQANTDRTKRLKVAKNQIAIGIVVTFCGLVLFVKPLIESALGYPAVTMSCLMPLVLIIGAVILIKGYFEFREESRRNLPND